MADETDKIDGVAGAGDDIPMDRGDEVKSPLDGAGKEDVVKGDKLDEGDETPEEKAEREKQEAEEAKKRNAYQRPVALELFTPTIQDAPEIA